MHAECGPFRPRRVKKMPALRELGLVSYIHMWVRLEQNKMEDPENSVYLCMMAKENENKAVWDDSK